jgi:N-sulfoglucosamine sulfohydrolase
MPERPFLQPNDYKERSYPVWNLIKELAAQGKLTPVQAVLAAPSMPPEEIYDVDQDPYEIHNLVDSVDSEHRAALERLRHELGRWIEESDDQGRHFEPPGVAAARGATRPGSNPNGGAVPESKARGQVPKPEP